MIKMKTILGSSRFLKLKMNLLSLGPLSMMIVMSCLGGIT